MAKEDIKEVMEVLVAVEVLLDKALEALEDGKIGISDIPLLFGLISPVSDAIKGISTVIDEIKDIDVEEAKAIAEKSYSIVAKIAKLFA